MVEFNLILRLSTINVLPANKGLAQTFRACVVTQAAACRAQVLADSDQDNESIIPDDASDLDPTEHWEQQVVSGPQLPVEASDFFYFS